MATPSLPAPAPVTAVGAEPLPTDVKLLQAQLSQAQAALRQEVERRTALQNLMEEYEKTIATMIGTHAFSGETDTRPGPLADWWCGESAFTARHQRRRSERATSMHASSRSCKPKMPAWCAIGRTRTNGRARLDVNAACVAMSVHNARATGG